MDLEDVNQFEQDGRRAVRAATVARQYEGLDPDAIAELNAEAAAQRLRDLLRS